MEKLCIDVRGFSEEKKKRVQDAFFKLGIKWFNGCAHQYLDADGYGNVCGNGDSWGWLVHGYGDMYEQQRKYAVTYPDLMRKAGMDESDPDATISALTKKGLERSINRLQDMAIEAAEIGEQRASIREKPATLQDAIESYMYLLDSIKDPYARGVIKSQITDLTDLQYNQLTGERTNA